MNELRLEDFYEVEYSADCLFLLLARCEKEAGGNLEDRNQGLNCGAVIAL